MGADGDGGRHDHPVGTEGRAKYSDGLTSPAMEVRIADDAGNDVPTGTSGRLLTRGASQFVGYFERPELTRAAVDADGWLDTGDLASIDSEGFVRSPAEPRTS